jgi:hypothetical protein
LKSPATVLKRQSENLERSGLQIGSFQQQIKSTLQSDYSHVWYINTTVFLLLVGWDQVPCTAATSGLLYQPQMIGEGDCGAIGGMKIGRRNRSTRRKPVPAPLCPPQIPLDQTPGSNPGRRGGKPATNRLSYGAAIIQQLHLYLWNSPLLFISTTNVTTFVTTDAFCALV